MKLTDYILMIVEPFKIVDGGLSESISFELTLDDRGNVSDSGMNKINFTIEVRRSGYKYKKMSSKDLKEKLGE